MGTNTTEALQCLQAASQPLLSRDAGGATGSQRPLAPLPQEPTVRGRRFPTARGAPSPQPGGVPHTAGPTWARRPQAPLRQRPPLSPRVEPAAPARCLALSFMLSPSPSPSPAEGKRERAWAAAGRLPVSQAAELKRRRAREKEAEQLSRGRGRLLSAASLAALPGGICRDGVGGRRERCCTTDLFCCLSPVLPSPHTHQRRRGEGRRPPCLASPGRRVRTPGCPYVSEGD